MSETAETGMELYIAEAKSNAGLDPGTPLAVCGISLSGANPVLLPLGPAGWHGAVTDRYDSTVAAGTLVPPGLVMIDPGGANGLGIDGDTELEMVAAGVRGGKYRYHPLNADGRILAYPYLYFFAEDGSWNLRAASGTASGGTIAITTGDALPDAGGVWESYYGALREPHPVILRHTPAYTMPGGGWHER